MPGSNAKNKPNEPNSNYTKMYKHIKNKLTNNETINKNVIMKNIFGNTSQYSNMEKEALYSLALLNAKKDFNRNKAMSNKHTGPSLLNNIEAASNNMRGGKKKKKVVKKRKPTGKKKVRKIHKGPRGGRYYVSKGRKVYL